MEVAVFSLRPEEVYSGGAGEGEGLLRQVFATAARAAPAVLLLHDIDRLCARREEGRDTHARVVAQVHPSAYA